MANPHAKPPQPDDSLSQRIRQALIWRSGGQLLAQGVQWGATFVVIRILSPSDYGLFAMTQAVLVLLNLANGYGLSSALIQRRDADTWAVRQVFGMLIALNIALAVIQVAAAPLVAAYYRHPEIAAILRVQAVLYLATPFIALSQALLSRAMDFRRQAQATIASSIAGAGTALAGALAGCGVWTLVAAPVVLFGVRAAMMTQAAGWVRPSFAFRGAGEFARFGGVVAAGQLCWFLQSQADIVLAGRRFSAHDLGLYSTALLLTQVFVTKVMPPLNEIALAGYARLHANGDAGPDAFGDAFVQASRLVMAVALPFALGLFAVATPLVSTVLGEEWRGAGPIVRVAALAMPFATMLVLLPPACEARGRPGVGVWNGAAGAAILLFAFAIGVDHGPIGLAWAWSVAYPVYLAVSLWRALPVIGVSAARLGRSMAPLVAAAGAMAIAVLALDAALPPMPAPLRLAVLVAFGAASYAALLFLRFRDVIAASGAVVRPARPA